MAQTIADVFTKAISAHALFLRRAIPDDFESRIGARASILVTVIDERVRALISAGDTTSSTALVVETYGLEVYGYLVTLLRDEDLASDAFAATCEDLLKGIAKFRAESSLRTWLYTLARHAAYREARGQRKRRGERLSGLADALQAPVRTATAAFRRTAVKDELSRLREALTDEERELLLLRIDRGLSWQDIAAIRLADGEPDDLKREAARCRKQFERTKEKLHELARKAGILPLPEK